MKQRITVTLSEEEATMILEALETDREIYLASARDAVADGSARLALTLQNAADRICAFRTRFLHQMSAQGRRRPLS